MTGIAHALIGAAIGALSKNPWSAFIHGIVSHGAADAAPHRDLPPLVEVPLLTAALYAIGKRYGLDSKQFTGALGGILPDAEHGLMVLGIIRPEDEIYPTHVNDGEFHGPDSGEHYSQVLVGLAALLVAEIDRKYRS